MSAPLGVGACCIKANSEGSSILVVALLVSAQSHCIFKPFFTTEFSGPGLSIILGIVQEHGECITVWLPAGTVHEEVENA